jgi:hypothetical protein
MFLSATVIRGVGQLAPRNLAEYVIQVGKDVVKTTLYNAQNYLHN